MTDLKKEIEIYGRPMYMDQKSKKLLDRVREKYAWIIIRQGLTWTAYSKSRLRTAAISPWLTPPISR